MNIRISFQNLCGKLVFKILIFLLQDNISAQDPSFIHYNVNNGLPSNLVYYAYQDSKGLLWFATDKGLVCFNNNKFRTYTTSDGLPDYEVLNVWEDRAKKLWISCFRKNLCYLKRGKIVTVNSDSILKKIDLDIGLCNFYQEGNSKVWFSGLSQRFFSLSKDTVKSFTFPDAVVHMANFNKKLYALATRSIIEVKNNILPKIIFQFDKERITKFPFAGLASNGAEILYSFIDVAFLLKIEDGNIKIIDSLNNVSGKVSVDRTGHFWIGSLASGAVYFNEKDNLHNPKYYLKGKKVTHILEDNQGTLWFTTLDDGVFCLPRNSPIVFDDLQSKNIISITHDGEGNIYSGDDEGFLYKINSKISINEHFVSNDGYNRILKILPVNKKGSVDLWIVADEGLFLKSKNSCKRINAFPEGPKAILFDDVNIFCGTSGTLHKISYISLDTISIFPIYERITALSMDSDHTIWAGGIDGLYSSKDSFQTNWGDIFPILNSRIVAIQNGAPNQLWIVTPESGLLMCTVNQGKIIKIVQINTFLKNPIESIQSLFREENGRIWLATNTGIYGITPNNWKTLHFNHYDGLANDDVRSIVVYHDTLWAGTASGVTRMVLKPAPLKGDFPTYVTAVRYQQQKTVYEINTLDSIPPGQEVLLPPDASLVELEFTGLNYKSRGNLFYECITTSGLLPFQWWTTDNLIDWVWNGFKEMYDTTMIYKSSLAYGVTLTPGRYKVNTLAITAGGTRSNQSDTCAFIMRPSWYAFVWFHLIIWGILGCLTYYIYQTRVQLREMAIALAQSRLLAFQAQINPHFVGNAINAVQRFFYPPSPMHASIYTATLTRLLRKTLHYSEKFFLPFHEEVQYSLDYLGLAQQRLGKDKFYYTVIGADSIRRDMPFPTLFLQPILENATLHGIAPRGVTKVEVAFSKQHNRLICTVQDNGLGISVKSKASEEVYKEGYMQSKGMKILRNKAEILNQLYNIDLRISAEDLSEKSPSLQGTRFTISFLMDKVNDSSGQPLLSQQSDTTST